LRILVLELVYAVRYFYQANCAGCLVEVADARSISLANDQRGARAFGSGSAKEVVRSESLFFAADPSLDVLALEHPAHLEAVSSKTSMERARGLFAVEIDKVPPRDHSKLSKVEMGVERLKRVVRPGDLVDSFLNGELALREF